MSSKNFKKISSLVTSAQNIVILPSKRLDADAVGSALALKAILAKLGKSATIIYCGTSLENLAFLPGAGEVLFDDPLTLDFNKFDLAFFLDGAELYRFYDSDLHQNTSLVLPPALKKVVIDHHVTTAHFGDLEIFNENASSTCQMVYEIFRNEVEFDQNIATSLLSGISTDTGHFRYSNTTSSVLRAAADLIDLGANISDLVVKLFSSAPLKVIRSAAGLVADSEYNEKYHYLLTTVDYKDARFVQLTTEELKLVIILTRDVFTRMAQEVDFVVSLKDDGSGLIHGSFRSRNQGKLDLAKLATYFVSGGGHKEAAGFRIKAKSLSEAKKELHRVIALHYDEIKVN